MLLGRSVGVIVMVFKDVIDTLHRRKDTSHEELGIYLATDP